MNGIEESVNGKVIDMGEKTDRKIDYLLQTGRTSRTRRAKGRT